MNKPQTLGELKKANYRSLSVKDEMRSNLLPKLASGEPLFPGIIGYDDTVVPQIANAILSRHNFILLGLRGQAKSRILRALTILLDAEIPFLAGCEINDDPLKPICRACHERLRELADQTPIDYLPRELRYVEKLATPDVTIADIIGDLDPIKAARGKIITPLKDRIGSEIRTHYPATLEHAIAITAQEAWTDRDGSGLAIPRFVRELIESAAFEARQEKRVDKRSGVSQRLPITCLENVVSNAEQRALRNREDKAVPRPSDLYSAIPSLTGKFELEYEGELKGAENVARDIIRQATAKIFRKYFDNVPLHSIVQWFEMGGSLKYSPNAPTQELYAQFKKIQGLLEKTQALGIKAKDDPALLVAGGEFILEGLYALRRISRSEELGYHAEPARAGRAEPSSEEPSPTSSRRRGWN
jgi:Mg-chelatase subunit ChlI